MKNRIVNTFLILICAVVLASCQKEYVQVNKCPVVNEKRWETVQELYLEWIEYKKAYQECSR